MFFFSLWSEESDSTQLLKTVVELQCNTRMGEAKPVVGLELDRLEAESNGR